MREHHLRLGGQTGFQLAARAGGVPLLLRSVAAGPAGQPSQHT